MHLTTTPREEVAQTLTSATSKRGLNREVRAALLRVKTGTECPEDNLKEIMRRRWDHVDFLELRRDSRVTTGISGFLLCWPREA